MKILNSERLLLRKIRKRDYTFIKYYLSDPERTQFLPLEKPYPENEVNKWFSNRIFHWKKNKFGTFIIQEKISERHIGFCGLEYVQNTNFIDIRYGLIQDFWGKGYAYEAAFRTIKYGFEQLGLETIYGAAVPENYSSIRILEKIGMNLDNQFDCYGNVVDPYSIKKHLFT
ncbi:MAG: GNAT family N-acetyltransferase [archaeon]|nr:GNAT family N-acetyltransferase [archaeon]